MKIHFIGIGGIGVSALAQYYLSKGHQVRGSDLASSGITQFLKKKGVRVFIGQQQAKNLSKGTDLVVFSPAVKRDNPELKAAKKAKIECLSYPQALGELTRKFFTIAISGTHGKSTTTAMVGLILVKAGFDPTVIVGTKVKQFKNNNFRAGRGNYLVIEACEYDGSFLNYQPDIILITNIEAEHLDYFKNFANVLKAFRKFVGRLKKGGFLIREKDYKLAKGSKRLRGILKVPGEFNLRNALAALSVARALKIPDKVSFEALSEYQGSWRRFEERKKGKLTIVSDYAHHPTEIKATLRAAREKYPQRKIWLVYQPHQYQRTYYLFGDFVKTFREAPVDRLILTDVYDVAGREDKKIKEKISSEKMVKKIAKDSVVYLPKKKILSYLKDKLEGREVVIIMGAGDIFELVDCLCLTSGRKRKRMK